MAYLLPGRETADDRLDRKATLIALLVLGVCATGLILWLAWPFGERDSGLQFAWNAVYTDSRIASRLGSVVDAHIKQERISRRRGVGSRDVHQVEMIDGTHHGRIEFMVVGKKDVGTVIIYYVRDSSGNRTIKQVDVNPLSNEEVPNKAPEPTPGAFTPRATEGASK